MRDRLVNVALTLVVVAAAPVAALVLVPRALWEVAVATWAMAREVLLDVWRPDAPRPVNRRRRVAVQVEPPPSAPLVASVTVPWLMG